MKQGRWWWFFLPLIALASAGVVIPIVYNLRLQLNAEQLTRAVEKWLLNGTPNYDLQYIAKYDHMPEADEVWIRVRDDKVVQAIVNGEVLRYDNGSGLALGLIVRTLPERDFSSLTVEGLFDKIKSQLLADSAATGRRNYATATFDVRDGHPIRYVHRVAGTKVREEFQIKLTRVAP